MSTIKTPKNSELTIKEALEQGYTKYGYFNREWQTTQNLHVDIFKDEEEYEHENLCLFEKKSKSTSISSEAIAEILSDHIGCMDGDECARDDDIIYDVVMKIDFTETANMINKKLEEYKYWMLTNIKIKK